MSGDDFERLTAQRTSALMAGQIAATLISFAGTIVLVFFLGSSDFGILNVLYAIPFLISMISDIGMRGSCTTMISDSMNKGDGIMASRIATTGLLITCILGVICTGTLLLLSNNLVLLLLGSDRYLPSCRYAILGLLTNSVFNTTGSIIIGFGRMREMSALMVIHTSCRATISPWIVYLGFGINGALVGFLSAQTVAITVSLIFIYSFTHGAHIAVEGPASFYSIAHEMIVLGLPISFSHAIDYSATPLLNVLLSQSASHETIGYFNVAASFSGLVLMITTPLSNSFFQAFSIKDWSQKRTDLFNLFRKSVFHLELILIPLLCVLSLISIPVVTFLYGSEFYIAGQYLSIFVFTFLASALGLPICVSFLKGTRRTYSGSGISVLSLVSSFAIIIWIVVPRNITNIIISLTAGPMIALVIGYLLIWKMYGLEPEFKKLLAVLIVAAVGLILSYACKSTLWFLPTYFLLLSVCSIFILTYLILLVLFRVVDEGTFVEMQTIYEGKSLLGFVFGAFIIVERALLHLITGENRTES